MSANLLRPSRVTPLARRHSITARIARRDINTSTTLGQHRWAIERTVSWLSGY